MPSLTPTCKVSVVMQVQLRLTLKDLENLLLLSLRERNIVSFNVEKLIADIDVTEKTKPIIKISYEDSVE